MDIGIISVRYARALFLFAKGNGEEDAVYTEMQTLGRSFQAVPALQGALKNPTFTDKTKVSLLLTATTGTEKVSVSVSRFIPLVVKNGRSDMMLFIAASYLTLYRQEKNLTEARLTFAGKVSPAIVGRVRKMLEDKLQGEVSLHVDEDKALLGGFVLEFDTYRLDASLRSQLQQLRRELVVS